MKLPRGVDGANRSPRVSSKNDEIVELYRSSVREIFGYSVRRLFTKHLAEDATSAVFLRLVEQYSALRHKGRPEIRNWLYGTASNVIAAYLLDAKRQKEIAENLARERQREVAVGREGEDRLDWPVLYEAIGRLKRRQQEVVVLRYFQGLETSAIAEALGMRHVAVRVLLWRAVKRLRQELEKPFGEPHTTP
jgi:RNA polymerase sigma factor (sigma-70 family)